MKVTDGQLWQFIKEKHPRTYKYWIEDEKKFKDGKIKRWIDGKEVKFGDRYSPLIDPGFDI